MISSLADCICWKTWIFLVFCLVIISFWDSFNLSVLSRTISNHHDHRILRIQRKTGKRLMSIDSFTSDQGLNESYLRQNRNFQLWLRQTQPKRVVKLIMELLAFMLSISSSGLSGALFPHLFSPIDPIVIYV